MRVERYSVTRLYPPHGVVEIDSKFLCRLPSPPGLSAHNPEILGGLLGLSDGELAALRDEGVV